VKGATPEMIGAIAFTTSATGAGVVAFAPARDCVGAVCKGVGSGGVVMSATDFAFTMPRGLRGSASNWVSVFRNLFSTPLEKAATGRSPTGRTGAAIFSKGATATFSTWLFAMAAGTEAATGTNRSKGTGRVVSATSGAAVAGVAVACSATTGATGAGVDAG